MELALLLLLNFNPNILRVAQWECTNLETIGYIFVMNLPYGIGQTTFWFGHVSHFIASAITYLINWFYCFLKKKKIGQI